MVSQGSLQLETRGKLSTRRDIINVILGRGYLSKDEIKSMWNLDEDGYANLKDDLDTEALIEPGPRGSGGFTAKFNKRPKASADGETDTRILASAWEQAAADRISELLSHAELEELLGDLVYTIRQFAFRLTQVDRRGTKSDCCTLHAARHRSISDRIIWSWTPVS